MGPRPRHIGRFSRVDLVRRARLSGSSGLQGGCTDGLIGTCRLPGLCLRLCRRLHGRMAVGGGFWGWGASAWRVRVAVHAAIAAPNGGYRRGGVVSMAQSRTSRPGAAGPAPPLAAASEAEEGAERPAALFGPVGEQLQWTRPPGFSPRRPRPARCWPWPPRRPRPARRSPPPTPPPAVRPGGDALRGHRPVERPPSAPSRPAGSAPPVRGGLPGLEQVGRVGAPALELPSMRRIAARLPLRGPYIKGRVSILSPVVKKARSRLGRSGAVWGRRGRDRPPARGERAQGPHAERRKGQCRGAQRPRRGSPWRAIAAPPVGTRRRRGA